MVKTLAPDWISDRPTLTRCATAGCDGVGDTAAALQRLLPHLDGLLRQLGFRVNRVLPRDGSERMNGPLPLATYTVLTLPAAASWTGAIVFVSDAAPGSKFQGSDGAAWVPLG